MRLVDADALSKQLIKHIKSIHCDNYIYARYRMFGVDDALSYIKDAPTIDAVRHRHWIKDMVDTPDIWVCGECRFRMSWRSKYCPNCGARMDGGN